MSESLSYPVCNYWENRELRINTNFSVTGWMLCVITHIRKYSSDHSDDDNGKQDNTVIKTFFNGWSEDELNFTLELFWTEYTDFDKNDWTFDGDGFICKREYIIDGNSNLWHQKY